MNWQIYGNKKVAHKAWVWKSWFSQRRYLSSKLYWFHTWSLTRGSLRIGLLRNWGSLSYLNQSSFYQSSWLILHRRYWLFKGMEYECFLYWEHLFKIHRYLKCSFSFRLSREDKWNGISIRFPICKWDKWENLKAI